MRSSIRCLQLSIIGSCAAICVRCTYRITVGRLLPANAAVGLRGPLRAYHVDVAQDLHGLHLRHRFFAKAPASRGLMRPESGFPWPDPWPDPGLHRLHRASTDNFVTVFMYVASICYY